MKIITVILITESDMKAKSYANQKHSGGSTEGTFCYQSVVIQNNNCYHDKTIFCTYISNSLQIKKKCVKRLVFSSGKDRPATSTEKR